MRFARFLTRPGVFLHALTGALLVSFLLIGFSLVTTRSVSAASVASADSGQAVFSLQPVKYDPSNPLTRSYFIFEGKTGTTIQSSVRVTNSGTASGSVNLYPVDATTGQTSGAVYLSQNDPRKDVGAWITLSQQKLTLAPGQNQVVTFQVSIPSSARAGQHLGGIVAEAQTPTTTSTQSGSSNIQIKVKNLAIIAVQVNLPGTQVEQLSATGIQAGGQNGYQQLLLGLSNSGTDMLKPSGTLQIANAQGQVLKHFTLKLDTFLPQTSIQYPVNVTGQGLAPGDYQGTLDLSYGDKQTLHSVIKFSIGQQQVEQVFNSGSSSKTVAPPGFGTNSSMPLWQLVLSIGGALAILWIVGSLLYRRLVLAKTKAATPPQFRQPF